MSHSQKTIVQVLVFCIAILPLNELAALAGDAPAAPEQVKQQIDQYGVGAKLKLQLADGKKLKGSVTFVGDDSFELKTKPSAEPRQIAYNNVNQVKLAKLVYRAKGAPDPVEARRVVLGLGVGHHIQVKTAAGMEYHGNVAAIDSESFTMLPDRATAPVQIAFADVTYVEQNLSKGATIAIIAGASAAAVVLIVLAIMLARD